MDPLPVVHTEMTAIVDLLARDYRAAEGPLLAIGNRLGGGIEAQLARLPDAVRVEIDRAVRVALTAGFGVAGMGPDLGRRAPMLGAVMAGAAGGAGGMVTSLVELPVTVTMMLAAIRAEAVAAGYDPAEAAVRLACLEVFAAGSPLTTDDGVNTAFVSARLTLAGPTLRAVIARVAPRLALVLGQKLALQAVPVLGALTGAGLNAAYLRYYREMARIRFALLRLSEVHGAEAVLARFGAAVGVGRLR